MCGLRGAAGSLGGPTPQAVYLTPCQHVRHGAARGTVLGPPAQLGSAWPLAWGARGLSPGERVASRLGSAWPLGWGARGLSAWASGRAASRLGGARPLGWGARGLSGGERVASRLGSAVGATPLPQLPMSRHRPRHRLADLPSHPRQRVAAKRCYAVMGECALYI